MRNNNAPFFQPRFVGSFLFVIRKLKLVLCRFFIMHITRVASFEALQLVHKDELASVGYVEDLAANGNPLHVEWVAFTVLDLVKWLVCRAKSLVNLEET